MPPRVALIALIAISVLAAEFQWIAFKLEVLAW